MDRITKHDLYRRLDLLNHYLGEEAYDLSWANGGVRIYEARRGEDVGRRGTKRDVYEVLGGMCHVSQLYDVDLIGRPTSRRNSREPRRPRP